MSFSLSLSLTIHGAAIGVGYSFWRSGLMTLPGISVQGGTGAEEGSRGPSGDTISVEPMAAEGLNQPIDLPESPVDEISTETPSQISDLTIPSIDESQAESKIVSQAAPGLPIGPILAGSGELSVGISAGSTSELPSTWVPTRGKGSKPGDGSGDGIAGLSPTPHARNKSPNYPEEARRRGQEGTVLLRVAVREDGTVETVAIATSCGFELLDQAAIEAVKHWLFDPARFDGKPQRCEIQLPVRFVLKT